MRYLAALTAVAILAAACSDAGVSPTSPDGTPTTIRANHTGSMLGDPTIDDLCGGLSPCDAFDYDRDGDSSPDGVTGVSGFCFLSPMVENHLSDAACSGDFVPGLEGQLQLAYCEVEYPTVNDEPDGELDGSRPPKIVECQDPADWQDFTRDSSSEFYRAEVQFKKNVAKPADQRTFRLYVVHNGVHFAHRDVIVDPNLTTPADGFVHAIGNGKEPVKLRVTDDAGCAFFDTQDGGTENAASCLIAGETTVPLQGSDLTATFTFLEGNPSFFAEFELSECLPLGFDVDDSGATPIVSGMPSVDTPLADCKVSLTSEQLESLTVPGRIELKITDERWSSPPFANARLNVIQEDGAGQGVLPPVSNPGWFGNAMSSSALFNLLGRGLNRVAAFFGAQPLVAQAGAGFNFRRLSDFQVAVMPVMDFDVTGGPCETPSPSCLNLGTVASSASVPVSVQVTAPGNKAIDAPAVLNVPDTRLHFFPLDGGTADCPEGSLGTIADPRGCYPAYSDDHSTDPPSTWDHTVVVTGDDGVASVDWSLGSGSNPHELKAVACGVARPGGEPNPPGEPGGDGVWGTLGDCSARSVSATGFDNGPADGLTPYEPVDTDNEVAIYGLPLTFQASTCPQIVVNGQKGDAFGVSEWEDCAVKTGFIAPAKGPKPSEDNAWLYTYNDADNLYVALEVRSNDLGEKIFINFVEVFAGGDGVAAAGDELLVLEFVSGEPGVFADWHFTQSCVGNNSNSLCGDPDSQPDGGTLAARAAATAGGAGSGTVFYEFVRPLNSPNNLGPNKEDLLVPSDDILGLHLQVTQGRGGGKGGFEFPDPQKDGKGYHQFSIQ